MGDYRDKALQEKISLILKRVLEEEIFKYLTQVNVSNYGQIIKHLSSVKSLF